jgi:DNA-binding beta-propeller fold protein YncE
VIVRLPLVLLLVSTASGQTTDALTPAGRIELPNVNGRIDHFSVDLAGQRLFMSALGNRSVEVLDVQAGKHLRSLPGLAEPQGVYFDAGSGRLFVACAQDGTVHVYDATSFKLLNTVKLGSDADNIRYDPRSREVLVGYGDGALAFLDSSVKKTAEIALDAHPESFQLEKTGARVFVNVPDKKEIQVVDLAGRKLVAKWPVTSALRNYPMALDEAGRRLFIGCRSPARLLAIDTGTGRQTAAGDIVGDTDDLFYDAARKLVYVIGGQGFVDVLRQTSSGAFERAARYATAAGARTGLFVPEWSKLFVAVPHRGAQHAEVLVFQAK